MRKKFFRLFTGGLIAIMLILSISSVKPFVRRSGPPVQPPPVVADAVVISALIDDMTIDEDIDKTPPPASEKRARFSLGGLFNRRNRQEARKMRAKQPSDEIKIDQTTEETNTHVFCLGCFDNEEEEINE